MGRKNKRVAPSLDGNFDKFMKGINTRKPIHDITQKIQVHNKVPEKRPFEKSVQKEFTREEKLAYRIKYAEDQFRKNDIQYKVMNQDGDIYCYRKSDMAIIQYNAFTGVIFGYSDFRGINAIVMLLLQEV